MEASLGSGRPALAAILTFAASAALANHQVRDFIGIGWLGWPFWLAAEATLVALP